MTFDDALLEHADDRADDRADGRAECPPTLDACKVPSLIAC
jgi:hypothetical protein